MKKLKQGQTIYLVSFRVRYSRAKPYIIKWFLHSHKTPLPEEGSIIEKMPVTHANHMADGNGYIFYTSRRKAESALKQFKQRLICHS